MLFPPDTLAGVAAGRIDLAFRRWERPRVRAGGRQRTTIGVIGFDSVEPVSIEELTDAEALRAGFASRAALVAFLRRRTVGQVFRIGLRLLGPDPRVALRDALPGADEMPQIEERLARLDRFSRHGPWTRAVLEAIHAHPGLRAADLAARFGRPTQPFKADVRKLKELGLTESLEVGYRLSPRGSAVVRLRAPEQPVQRRIGG